MITFDSVSLQDDSYLTRYVKHDAMPARSLGTLKISGRDGVIIISDTFDQKIVEVAGVIKASTQALLEAKIDEFRELLSRRQKVLDIDFAGSTRRYIATAINTDDAVDRDHYHNGFAPFRIHFLVPKGTGTDINRQDNNFAAVTAWNYPNTITVAGGYAPEPIITLTLTDAGTCDTVVFRNVTTNTTISVSADTGDFSSGDIITIDCEDRSVKLNGIDHQFTGVFPTFALGVNSFVVNFYGSTVGVEQSQVTVDSDSALNTDADRISQSFEIGGNNTCSQMDLILRKENV
jgi:phage-related protein